MTMEAVKFELVLAAVLLAVGLLPLPVAVYWVGQFVIGVYEGGGVGELLSSIWTELGRGSATAWILVLSPYVAIQLIRAARKLLRRQDVTRASNTTRSRPA